MDMDFKISKGLLNKETGISNSKISQKDFEISKEEYSIKKLVLEKKCSTVVINIFVRYHRLLNLRNYPSLY